MLTVVIATYNGATTIGHTLRQFTLVIPPTGGWKIIVVDNASTDSTLEILGEFQNQLPLEIHQEIKRGKNNALNSVLDRFEGDLIIFTDDDVLPKSDWLMALRSAADTNPDVDLFGGRISPCWPASGDRNLATLIPSGPAFAITANRHPTGPTSADNIWGPNMAVRASLFNLGNRFDGNVGPSAGQYIMGSETEFLLRMAKQGHQAYWVNEAEVEHIIRDHQLTIDWISARAFRYGRARLRNEQVKLIQERSVPCIFGVPRWIWRKYIVARLQTLTSRFYSNSAKNAQTIWRYGELRGMIFEAKSIQRETP